MSAKAVKEETFKNEPSKRLYRALTDLIDRKRLTAKDVATKFGKYEETPRNYFNAVSSAKISVTVEQILKAQEFFGIDPCKLFTEKGKGKLYSQEDSSPDWQLNDDELKLEQRNLIRSQQETIRNQSEIIFFLTKGERKKTS